MIYGTTPHGHFAKCSDPNTPISQFSQADINNADSICFVPDGSGQSPTNIQVTVNDGYTSPQTVAINFKYNVLQQQTPQPKNTNTNSNNNNSTTSQLISTAKAVGGTVVGAYAGLRMAEYARNVKNCFANFVYHEASLCYWNFSDADGKAFIDFIDKLVLACNLKQEINELVVEYKSHWCFGGEAGQKLSRYAKVFAEHLRDPELGCLEKTEHNSTKAYYWIKGTPLIADVLDKDANGNYVGQLSIKINETLEEQARQQQVQTQSPSVFNRMATMAVLPTFPKWSRDSPPDSVGTSSSSSGISLEVLTPKKATKFSNIK